MSLIPCESCARHLRASETICPFCGTARDVVPVATIEEPERFASRSHVMAFRARAGAVAIAAAVGTSGCYVAVPAYGAPAPDAGVEDAGARDAGQDAASVALYGGPPAP